MKEKEDKKYCHWKNLCKNEYLCCSFCDKLTCKYRCKDNCKKCLYLTTKDNITQLNKKPMGNKIDLDTFEVKKKKKEKS